MVRYAISLILAIGLSSALAPRARAQGVNHCEPGMFPRLSAGFATLAQNIGGAIGSPTTSEFADQNGTGPFGTVHLLVQCGQ